jgi:5-methylcytosine-specific restriction endonuclease McrA
MRRCFECKEVRPITEFEGNKNKPYQKSYRCMPCNRLRFHGMATPDRAAGWNKLPYKVLYQIMHSRTDCIYCHIPFDEDHQRTRDRKDSSVGYTADNVVLACRTCNVVKNNILTYDEMLVLGPIVRNMIENRGTSEDITSTRID